ncbi:hypothetical protein ACI48D_08715 [Massilia sp. LXY-6]|uniref:hypothetical protein n=1 Tax=Massilia sp. LXY-6 TaxID=3379823 RepID=UPI003EE29341
MKNSVHFNLQGKGGIGKTFASALLAQWIEEIAPGTMDGYDADQENASFYSYKGLSVKPVDVMRKDRTIDRKLFDRMLLEIFESKQNIVVDTGANTFSPLMSYLMESDFLSMLINSGKNVYVHTIIGGGDNLRDTTAGFISLARQTSCPMVLWLNENAAWGDTGNFVESEAFAKHAGNVKGVILLHGRTSDTFGDDVRRMNKERLTLKEIMQSPKFNLLERSRLNTVVRDVFNKLERVEW